MACLPFFSNVICGIIGSKSVFNARNLAKNITSSLLKTRKRFETMSGESTTDTEGGISPMWECEEVSIFFMSSNGFLRRICTLT